MRFISKISGASTTVEPRTDPSLVPFKESVFVAESCLLNTDSPPTRTLLALEGTPAETATVQFWVLDDTGFNRTSEIDYAQAKWYSLGTAVVCTVGDLVEGPALPGGRIYAQITVASSSASVVKIGSAP